MTDFTDEQKETLATLTIAYPAGITLTDDRVHRSEEHTSELPSR